MTARALAPDAPVWCRTHPDTLAEASCARCGDFMCPLCGPISSRPLCARCSARGAVDWEERDDQSWGRALWGTFQEAVSTPRTMGERLSGTGRVGLALSYLASCALIGSVPLSLVVAALLITVADPLTLGIRSTGVLSLAVTVVLACIGFATLLPLGVLVWSACVVGVARLGSLEARFEPLARVSAYGLSLVAVPLFGPALLPLAAIWMLVAAYASLRTQAGARGAILVLASSLSLCLLPFVLFAWR